MTLALVCRGPAVAIGRWSNLPNQPSLLLGEALAFQLEWFSAKR